jgi:hypothetical protein
MKRIASLVAATFAVLLLTASASASSTSITLDQAEPVAPGSTVTFTVLGNRAAFIENVCLTTSWGYTSETKPVGSSFVVPSDAASCNAYLLDARGQDIKIRTGRVGVFYCVLQPDWGCSNFGTE